MKQFFFTLLVLGFVLPVCGQDSSTYFYQKGLEEKSAKRYTVASTFFEHAILLNPKFTQAYIENGNVNLAMRRTDAAKMNFTRAAELEPGNVIANTALLDLYYSYHQYKKALDLAQACTGCQNAERITALSLFRQQDYAKAERPLLRQISQNPNDAELMYAMGKSYMEMELAAKAIVYYEKAVKLDNQKPNWYFELAMIYSNAENYKNAVINFNKAGDNGFPASNAFNENLGYAYLYSGEFEKGEKMLMDIHDKIRGNKDILRDLAEYCYNKKMYDKSLEYCQKLMEIDLNDAKALYQAGLCFQKKGQAERGSQMCDRAIELDPTLGRLRTKKFSAGL